MEKRNKKMKAGIAMVTAIVLALVGILSTNALAHPPQTPGANIPTATGNVIVTMNATDVGGSGVNYTMYSVWYRVTSQSAWGSSPLINWTKYTGAFTLTNGGYYQIHSYSVDKAGNIENEKSIDVRILRDTGKPTTTVGFTTDGLWIQPGSPD